MRALENHGETQAPDGTTLSLHKLGAHWIIRTQGRDLMTSLFHGSEEAMARLTCHAETREVLVGGLGMGFTLRAALDAAPEATVTVAELVPGLVAWNEGPLGPLANHPLRDPRSRLHLGDVGALLRDGPRRWDAVLLDVDNGPDAFTRTENAALYSVRGLRRARATLRPGGVLAVWSAYPADAFVPKLADAGFRPEVVRVRAHGGKGAHHVIYLGWC